MELITEVAQSQNIIIVATIHQPSSKVYEAFDQIMILSGGREAYCGQADEAPSYFASLGLKMQTALNPAEFFLDLVNSDFTPQEDVDKILDAWKQKKANEPLHSVSSSMVVHHYPTRDSLDGRTLVHEVAVMLHRHGLLVFRDPVLYLYRTLFFLVVNVLVALLFWPTRYRVQAEVLHLSSFQNFMVRSNTEPCAPNALSSLPIESTSCPSQTPPPRVCPSLTFRHS